ncbi:PrpF domain-containing protein [Nonomuraea sp. NPDC048916]|uniref:PrpF domain-containing protein n=1 Tax=Nonomuraea sp. NPDC048916 TaxID=3154232 RepID=UPI0033E041B3
MAAGSLGVTGYESPSELEGDATLKAKVEEIRLRAGELMGLGDVRATTVPKMTLVAPPRDGGVISTRTFIPHRVHTSIGVLGAVSVATAVLVEGSVAAGVACGVACGAAGGAGARTAPGDTVRIEHPTGSADRRDQQIKRRSDAARSVPRHRPRGLGRAFHLGAGGHP